MAHTIDGSAHVRSSRSFGRNHQLIRQWQILRRLASAHIATTYYQLAQDHGVSARTIRRDLAALQEAGFPLIDELIDEDTGALGWRMLECRDIARLMAARTTQTEGGR